ncbi:tol-pal system protein YbgF [Klebsiella pneumoniae]|nr:tol-pal system protein YbgF [Klebsiella pneumoniae]
MFKVGVIMQDKGDTAKAKAVYQQVISKYPGTDGALFLVVSCES